MERVHIQRFRSLADFEIQLQPGANVLIGANGSGKSNFMNFLGMTSWLLKDRRLGLWVGKEGGADDQLHGGTSVTQRLIAEISVAMETGSIQYEFTLTHSRPDQLLFEKERLQSNFSDGDAVTCWQSEGAGYHEAQLGLSTRAGVSADVVDSTRKTASTVVGLLLDSKAYQFHDTSWKSNFMKGWDVQDNWILRSDGGNLAAILLRLQREDSYRFDTICRLIGRELPEFDRFAFEERNGKVWLQWHPRRSGKTTGAHLTSDGSLRFFALATLLQLPSERLPGVLLLDEHELGLHPKAFAYLSELIRAVAETRQVIVATQSPLLVDGFELEEIAVMENRAGRSELRSLDIEGLTRWLDDYSAGDLWLKNLLGGHP